MAKFDFPPSGSIHSEFPQDSGSVAEDLKNLLVKLIEVQELKDQKGVNQIVVKLFQFLKKHYQDIESQCKKNGWKPGGKKDFTHSLTRATESSHQFIENQHIMGKKAFLNFIIDSTEELLFFLNNESN